VCSVYRYTGVYYSIPVYRSTVYITVHVYYSALLSALCTLLLLCCCCSAAVSISTTENTLYSLYSLYVPEGSFKPSFEDYVVEIS
jgi:hypothetical protein